MNFRQIALIEAYSRLRSIEPDADLLGEEFKDNGKPLTDREMKQFRIAWAKEVQRLEKRLEAAKVDFLPAYPDVV